MDLTRITITIDASADILAAIVNAGVSGRGAGTSRAAAVTATKPSTTVLVNCRKGKAEISRVGAMKNESSKRRKAVSAAVQSSRSPIRRSPMPPLPYPPKHKINSAWKKVPPIPKLTVATGPATARLTWDDGISLGSYHLYAAIAGHELFTCVFGDEADHQDARWEKLTFVEAAPLSHNRRQPVSCAISNMVTEAEYYFAVRSVDVHDRRGPFAIVYARL